MAASPIECWYKLGQELDAEMGTIVGVEHPLDVEIDVVGWAVGVVAVVADFWIGEALAAHDDAGVALADTYHEEAVGTVYVFVFIDAPFKVEFVDIEESIEIVVDGEVGDFGVPKKDDSIVHCQSRILLGKGREK